MAVIKCKMCGGDIAISDDKTFGTCEYCGSTMTLPKVSDEQRAAAFNRGNHFRRMGEFDKALAVYERIVGEDDNDAEAHWCCALCRFGIEYVEDPATYEWLPTCHRASFDSFLEDVDYLAALEHSDGITRRQYQKDAAKIAEVQRGILATSQNEQPFDVFICYKESDDSGNRTVDSTLAQDIYYQLADKGYRVFFSRITLEDKAGTEYEPYIFAALNSARVMIAVGTKPEYYNAVWVKNEWSRFLALMRKDRTKLLLPCYRDMDPYDLPEQLSVLQSYDMGKIGFIQDLIRGVSKVLDTEKEAHAPVKEKVVVQQSSGGVNLTAQLKRGQQALEDRDWKKADEFFDRALDIDAECAEAFWGKALAAAQCVNGEDLIKRRTRNEPKAQDAEHLTACERDEHRVEMAVQNYMVPGYLYGQEIRDTFAYDKRQYDSLTNAWRTLIQREIDFWNTDRLMSRAVRFAKGDFAVTLENAREQIDATLRKRLNESESADKRAAQQIRDAYQAQMELSEQKVFAQYDYAVSNRQRYYDELCSSLAEAKTPEEFDRIAGCFENENLSAFADCVERAKMCRAEAKRLRKEAEQLRAEADRQRTEKAAALAAKSIKMGIIGSVTVAAVIAALVLYTQMIMRPNQYKAAEVMIADGNYDGAIKAFTELGNYKDSAERVNQTMIDKAEKLEADGDIAHAAMALAEIKTNKDAKARGFALWRKIANRPGIAAGWYHTVGLKADGTAVATGDNNDGQCGVNGWTDIVAVSAGVGHTVGLKADGTVVATGWNEFGQCGVKDWTDIVAIVAGGAHTVGLKANGTVIAIGNNEHGQCGVIGWKDIVAVAAGGYHTVGLKADGTVVAVGSIEANQCSVNGWTDIVAIAAGGAHTIGLKADGRAIAVGYNEYGQCDVNDWTDIRAVVAGRDHTVGLKADGTAIAVGNNEYGQCGVNGRTDIVAVAAGANHTVELKTGGTVVAVGDNGVRQCDVKRWSGIKAPER